VSDNRLFGPRTLAVRQFLEAIQGLTIEQWRARRHFDALYLPFMGVIPLATINGVH